MHVCEPSYNKIEYNSYCNVPKGFINQNTTTIMNWGSIFGNNKE